MWPKVKNGQILNFVTSFLIVGTYVLFADNLYLYFCDVFIEDVVMAINTNPN